MQSSALNPIVLLTPAFLVVTALAAVCSRGHRGSVTRSPAWNCGSAPVGD